MVRVRIRDRTQGTARLLAREGAWLEASWSEGENVGGGAGSRGLYSEFSFEIQVKTKTSFVWIRGFIPCLCPASPLLCPYASPYVHRFPSVCPVSSLQFYLMVPSFNDLCLNELLHYGLQYGGVAVVF